METMNQICHIEYEVTNIERAQAFYQGLFGWEFRQFMPTMVVFGQGENHIGGLMLVDSVTPGKSPSIWYKVGSLEECTAKAVKFGGTAPEEKHPVPGVGWSLSVYDPDGNQIGLVQYDQA